MSFHSPEVTLKMIREEADRAAEQSYWLSQLTDYTPSADSATEASADDHKRNLVERIVKRLAGDSRKDEVNA